MFAFWVEWREKNMMTLFNDRMWERHKLEYFVKCK